MGYSVLVEAALNSLLFFGCEAVATSQAELMSSATTKLERCIASAQALGKSDAACRRTDSSRLGDAGLIGDFTGNLAGQSSNTTPGASNPRGGLVGAAQVDPDAPSITFIARPNAILKGESVELDWHTNNVDQCRASEGWAGPRPLNGTETTDSMLQTTNFILTCRAGDESVNKAVTVWVTDPNPPPEVSLTATPGEVSSGTASNITWSVSNADSCTASGDWSGSRTTSGSESTGVLEQTSSFTLNCTGPGGTGGDTVVVSVDGVTAPPASFTRITIEQGQEPWGKNLADVDGDGALDVIQGGGPLDGEVYWYRAPSWQKYQVGTIGGGDDLQVGDINGDGAVDIVVNRYPIGWYENPLGSGGDPQGAWTMHPIGDYRTHDLEVVDINGDGKLDIAARLAGVHFSATTRIFLQGDTADDWTTIGLGNDIAGTGGLAVADLDQDGRKDVIGDGYWLRQPNQNITTGSEWLRYTIGSWPAGSSIDTADLNGDGRLDVTLAVSEVGIGDIAWFEAPEDPLTQSWVRHTIGTVEDVHRHHIVDMNNDGKLDIVFAEMYQSATDRVGVYYNDGDGASWTLQVIETIGSHNIAVGDVGNDGDIDILGANWRQQAPGDGDIYLWINNTNN